MALMLMQSCTQRNDPSPKNAIVFAMAEIGETMDDVNNLAVMGVQVVVRGVSNGWQATPKAMRQRTEKIRNLAEAARQKGILWSSMITSSAVFPDIVPEESVEPYAARDAHGRLIPTETWHQGCLNNPKWREFVKAVARATMDGGVFAIHYDESYSRWFWMRPMPCYCDHCIAQFREFLKAEGQAVPFDNYRAYLQANGFADRPWRSPFGMDYWRFLIYSTLEREREVLDDARHYAKERYGRPFYANANQYDLGTLSALLLGECNLYDFVSIGTGLDLRFRKGKRWQHVKRLPPDYTSLPHYLVAKAAAPDKPVTMFLDILHEEPDFSAVLPLEGKEQLMAFFVGEALAGGGSFALHYRFWNYRGPLNALKRLGQFQRRYEPLLRTKPSGDWSKANSPRIGVLFSFASYIGDMPAMHWGEMELPAHALSVYGLCTTLLHLNLPFEVLLLGEGKVFPYDRVSSSSGFRLPTPAFAKEFPLLVVPTAYALSDANLAFLRRYVQAGGLLLILGQFAKSDERFRQRTDDPTKGWARTERWDEDWEVTLSGDDPSLALRLLKRLEEFGFAPMAVSLTEEPTIWAVPRKAEDAWVLHLLHRRFDPKQGWAESGDLRLLVRLPKGETKIEALSPEWEGAISVSILERKGDYALLQIPSFRVWQMLVFQKAKT